MTLSNNDTTQEYREKKIKRSLNLIAEFVDGYAKDWYFAVGEYFKDELDIKYTPRQVEVIKNGVKQYEIIEKEGVKKKIVKKKEVKFWTQDICYCFAEGHTIYDNSKAYLQWNEALKHIKVICEVLRGTPTYLEEVKKKHEKDKKKYKIVNGHVTFKLSIPDKDKTGIETIGQYHLIQKDFVEFLKTGNLNNEPVDMLIKKYIQNKAAT